MERRFSPDVLGVQVLPMKFSYLTRGEIGYETSSVEVYERGASLLALANPTGQPYLQGPIRSFTLPKEDRGRSLHRGLHSSEYRSISAACTALCAEVAG